MTELRDRSEPDLFGRSCRALLTKAGGLTRARRLRDRTGEPRHSPELWARMAALGWLGICVPQAHGGAGEGIHAMLPVFEAIGGCLAPEPVLSAAMAAHLLALAGTQGQREGLLPGIAGGTEMVAVVGAGEYRSRRSGGLVVREHPEGLVLDGTSGPALDAPLATVLLVLVEGPPPRLLAVPRSSPGLRVSSQELIDLRNWGLVEFDGVPIPEGGHCDGGLVERAQDHATVAHCAEMLGSMWALFDRTLAHVKTRVQFGREIGSFQAVQHRLARLYTELLLADAVVREAATELDEHSAEAPSLVSAAKVRCITGSRLVCKESVQLHGGIGVTDECDVGLFVKNLRVAEFFLGDENWHADRWASSNGY